MATTTAGRWIVFVVLLVLATGKFLLDIRSWLGDGGGPLSALLLIDIGAVVLIVAAVLAIFIPHKVRVGAVRTQTQSLVSIRGNGDLRALLEAVEVNGLRIGALRPRLGFNAILSLDEDGLMVWTGRGVSAVRIPWSQFAGFAATERKEGFFGIPAVRVDMTSGAFASFLISDLGSGLFLEGQPVVDRFIREASARVTAEALRAGD